MKSYWLPAGISLTLTLLFFVIYPFCNWRASLRPAVGSFYFPWERNIPFVPIFIIPYTSMNFFYVSAPFIIESDRRRLLFLRRMAAAMLIATVFFLTIPLRFAFTRPSVHGGLGFLFDRLHAMDRPFNEFPSLHITFCLILAEVFVRRTRGLLRMALLVWFALIAASTLFTYQHHVIDVLGGTALAAICFNVFRDNPDPEPKTGR